MTDIVVEPVSEPLALITQIPRAGGTLLTRLLDGHPQLRSISHEWGTPFVGNLGDDPWQALNDHRIGMRNERGFRQARKRLNGEFTTFEFDLSPDLQEQIFRKLLGRYESPTRRDAYDCYISSYFAAWTNWASRPGEKRWVTAFAPRLLTYDKAMAWFFEIYPDGRLISVVRDPSSWYVSARRWSSEWAKPDDAADAWNLGARCALKWRKRYPNRVHLLSFERLLRDTREEMTRLAHWLEIDFDDSLLEPTFNKQPIKANSSFQVSRNGVLKGPLRRAERLEASERSLLESATATYIEKLEPFLTASHREEARIGDTDETLRSIP
jgi:hypothetical protein